ncbi:MAG: Eco29kI family restriction endonuclease [Chloroflexi bacterium]|nr:Eco29kI family restriction endonuclease [Chloroflexota bacterium]
MDFDYQRHVFKYPNLTAILGEAIEFFSKLPVHSLPPPYQFRDPGVYGLYYIGNFGLYTSIASSTFDKPLYAGKAVPSGKRTGRSLAGISSTLIGRLQEHAISIQATSNLKIEDFRCRLMILERDEPEEDLIEPIESKLIKTYLPLWNVCVAGFGIHTPGKGRFNQQPSEWDTLHPGRAWLGNLTGKQRDLQQIEAKIRKFLAALPT